MTLGTLTENRPWPVSRLPAGIQTVVAHDGVDQFVVGDPVGFQGVGVDDRFEHFLAVTLHLGVEHLGNDLYPVLEFDRKVVEHAFRYVFAHDVDLENREIVGAGLADDRFLDGARHLGPGVVHGFADVLERAIEVVLGIELDHDDSRPFRCIRRQLIDAVDVAQLDFQGHDQQPFGVLRRNSLVYDGYDIEGSLDVRLVGDGNGVAGQQTGHQHHEHDHEGGLVAVYGRVDYRVHALAG